MTTFATVETRPGDDRCVIRLSTTAGLVPGRPRTPLTQRLLDAVAAVPGVYQVSIKVADSDEPECSIVVYWADGADRVETGRGAWEAVREVLPDVGLRRAFWQDRQVRHGGQLIDPQRNHR